MTTATVRLERGEIQFINAISAISNALNIQARFEGCTEAKEIIAHIKDIAENGGNLAVEKAQAFFKGIVDAESNTRLPLNSTEWAIAAAAEGVTTISRRGLIANMERVLGPYATVNKTGAYTHR